MLTRPLRLSLWTLIGTPALLTLGGCWLDSSSVPDAGAAPAAPVAAASGPTTQAITVSGSIYAAPVGGSTVSLFAADAQGRATGAALATTTSDAQGHYTLSVASLPSGPVLIVATGGSYTSEADGSTQTLGSLSTLLPSVAAGANTAQLTPLTTAIAAATANLLGQQAGPVATAQASATSKVNALFGLAALSADPSAVSGDPNATTGNGWLIAALAGTLEQLRANTALSPAVLYQALQDDAADGKLDGLKNGQPITLTGGGTLSASLFTTQWSGAANAFGNSHPVYAGATTSISGALQVSAQSAGVAIGSSGSIAPLQTQAAGTQIYFAARGDGLVKLDMSDPANPVATKVASINSAVMVSAGGTYFSSLDGIVIDPTPINTASGAKVFALLYSYRSRTVVAVNLTDGAVADTATLTITRTTGFSGATASIAGGIADGVRNKIWLATGDGLLGLDPSNLKAAPVSIAQPAGTQINENLGGDPARDIVYTPDYDAGTLVIYNLAEARAYTMDATAWSQLINGWTPFEIDGVALDSSYQVAVMTPEGNRQIGLLTYTTPSGSSAAVGTIPSGAVFKNFTAGGAFSGSAIDGVSHTALFVGEGRGLGVGVIDNPANANWLGFSSFVAAPSSSYSFGPHDPHTVGAFNIQGKPYGFVLNGYLSGYQVVVLDLNAFLAMPSTNGVTSADPLTTAAVAKLLRY
ncbi:MAG: hypothetical protein KGI90_02100 [Burkholderiales bacterium]|nr:hypothetical protein [Burkholderiales bacterium]